MMSPPSPPREILLVIERTARTVAQFGLEREKVILRNYYRVEHAPYKPGSKTLLKVERSGFLKSDHPYHEFYRKKRDAYLAQCRDGTIHFRSPKLDDLKPPPNRDDPHTLFRHPPPDITPIELGLVKVTALFVARYGTQFWHALIDMYMFPHFSFLLSTDKSFSYYHGLVGLYQRVLRPHRVSPADEASITDEALADFFRYVQLEKLHERVLDLHALAYGLDYLDDDVALAIPPFSLMMHEDDIQPDATQCVGDSEPDDPIPTYMFPVRIPLKELGVIKLTALFVARHGHSFLRALTMREVTNPRFDFLFFREDQRPQFPSMEPAEIKSHIFNVLVYAYSKVLVLSNKKDHGFGEVLCCFFRCLPLEKLEEEGVKTAAAMVDLHAFVAGVDYLTHMHEPQYYGIMSPPQRLSLMIKNQSTLQTHPRILVLLPLGPKISDCCPQNSWLSRCSRLEYTFPPGIGPDELGVIKLTAQFVIRYGVPFEEALMKIAAPTTEFEFLKLTHSRNELFLGFIEVYCSILKRSKKVEKSGDHTAEALEFFFRCCLQLNKLRNGVVTSVIELSLFLSGVDYFAWTDVAGYSAIVAGPERRSVMMNRLRQMDTGGGIDQSPTLRTPLSFPSNLDGYASPPEISIIKLTAVFVARYGVHICRELKKKLETKRAVLEFMEPSSEWFHLYEIAVDAYSKVLAGSDDADTATVIERYFQCLQWEEQKKGSMTFDDDLYGFVEGVDCFAQLEDRYFSETMGNHRIHLHNCPCNQYDDEASSSKPKRQKVVEGSSSRIKVCVPTVYGRKVIEIAVESWLLEKVTSLKEKIAKTIQMQAKELKLRRNSGGVLKEDKSLAHNNVEAGEILTLTWRISRWTF